MAITSHKLPSAGDFARMEGELFTRLERSHTRRVRRHRLVAAAAAVLVVSGGSIAAGTVANPVAQSNLTSCYQGSDASSQVKSVAPISSQSTGGNQGPSDTARIDDAVQACTLVWQSGGLGAKVEHPLLQACIQDNLLVAVFRKSDDSVSASEFCDDLGMSAP